MIQIELNYLGSTGTWVATAHGRGELLGAAQAADVANAYAGLARDLAGALVASVAATGFIPARVLDDEGEALEPWSPDVQ